MAANQYLKKKWRHLASAAAKMAISGVMAGENRRKPSVISGEAEIINGGNRHVAKY